MKIEIDLKYLRETFGNQLLVGLIIAVFSFRLGATSSNVFNNDGYNNGVQANQIDSLEFIEQKSELQIENETHVSENKAKIEGFFGYWNNGKYFNARNNIGKYPSKYFTDELMEEFRSEMKEGELFYIKSNKLLKDVSNSEFYIATDHLIELEYTYNGKEYCDDVFITVGRIREKPREHHITEIKCKGTKGPVCDIFKREL